LNINSFKGKDNDILIDTSY